MRPAFKESFMLKSISLALLAAIVLTGCQSSNSGSYYSRGESQREQTVREGVVDSVRSVMIEGTKTPVGTLAGGVIGGVAGSNVGGGSGRVVGGVLGAVAGGLIGSAAEEGITRKPGYEITVRLNNGELRSVVQEADEQFHPGDRVRLVSQGGVTRVTH
jgi:outer membrane lipoprotein SlyB